MNKTIRRLRRAKKTRSSINRVQATRLNVHRSLNNIYAQVISATGGKVIASSSTLDALIKSQVKHGGNQDAAKLVGASIAQKAIDAGIKKVAFDRSGYKYHGRIKALADAAREGGLEF